MRAAVLSRVERDITHLDKAVFYNDDPSCAPSCYDSTVRMPTGVYKMQAFIDLGSFNCRLKGGLAAFKAGHWSCDPVYDAFYFRGDANAWAGSGFCGRGFDVLPPRKGSKTLRIQPWSNAVLPNIPDPRPRTSSTATSRASPSTRCPRRRLRRSSPFPSRFQPRPRTVPRRGTVVQSAPLGGRRNFARTCASLRSVHPFRARSLTGLSKRNFLGLRVLPAAAARAICLAFGVVSPTTFSGS